MREGDLDAEGHRCASRVREWFGGHEWWVTVPVEWVYATSVVLVGRDHPFRAISYFFCFDSFKARLTLDAQPLAMAEGGRCLARF